MIFFFILFDYLVTFGTSKILQMNYEEEENEMEQKEDQEMVTSVVNTQNPKVSFFDFYFSGVSKVKYFFFTKFFFLLLLFQAETKTKRR